MERETSMRTTKVHFGGPLSDSPWWALTGDSNVVDDNRDWKAQPLRSQPSDLHAEAGVQSISISRGVWGVWGWNAEDRESYLDSTHPSQDAALTAARTLVLNRLLPTYGLPVDPTDAPWVPVTVGYDVPAPTYPYDLPVDPTDAERRFATFGPEVGSSSVPALVRAGVRVWSFGYGDDPEEFTTLDPDDLWAFDGDDPDADVVDSWAPFRVDAR